MAFVIVSDNGELDLLCDVDPVFVRAGSLTALNSTYHVHRARISNTIFLQCLVIIFQLLWTKNQAYELRFDSLGDFFGDDLLQFTNGRLRSDPILFRVQQRGTAAGPALYKQLKHFSDYLQRANL